MSKDKYEQFKEWYCNSDYSNYTTISSFFEEFEESLNKNNYCCYDCKYLKEPYVEDDTGMPVPQNKYCSKWNDKDFEKVQSEYLEWVNEPEWEKHFCNDFKLKWGIRLHLMKSYVEQIKDRNKIWW